jgi:hypothetical protein
MVRRNEHFRDLLQLIFLRICKLEEYNKLKNLLNFQINSQGPFLKQGILWRSSGLKTLFPFSGRSELDSNMLFRI